MLLKLHVTSGWLSGCVKTYFPSVYNRFAKADPGQENPAHPFRCRYGVFPLSCRNNAANSLVHCLEHVGYRDVAGGVCAVLAYGDFDSAKSHHLVFHDLKLPMPALRSSLLAHSNVSLGVADSKEDALAGKGQKSGRLVWFAQANYIVSREIGMSLKRAKEKGLPTTYEGLYEHFRTEKGSRVVEVADIFLLYLYSSHVFIISANCHCQSLESSLSLSCNRTYRMFPHRILVSQLWCSGGPCARSG
jgi:hypothetical protein